MLKILLLALASAVFTVIVYIADRKIPQQKLRHLPRQILSGVLFGLLSILLLTISRTGISEGGAVISLADCAPICAGFFFGLPAGVLSGVIGGVYGYISSAFSSVGAYTQLACAVSMLLAGTLAGILRRYLFSGKKPTWPYGIVITLSVEVFHMLLIFLSNLSEATAAFDIVRQCVPPMLTGNAVAVGLALLAVNTFEVKKGERISAKTISRAFQRWLFLCIVIAFILTDLFTSVIETDTNRQQIENLIKTNLNDVYQDIRDASDENLLEKTLEIKEEYLSGEDLHRLAQKYNVTEINIIDKNGIIIQTNNPDYVGYEMASGEQSAEFLVLLSGEAESYVQDYRPTAYDNTTYRKYGAVVLENGGFLQVGYDASQFREDINHFVGKIARNRHIGTEGFIIICDEQRNIVTEGRKNFGKNVKSLVDMQGQQFTEGSVFETTFEGEVYFCSFRFVEGYCIIGVMSKDESMFMMDVSHYISTLMELSIFAALFILVYFLIKRLVIDNISKINKGLSRITDGDLDVVVDVHSTQEFTSLSCDINATVGTLKRYIAEAEARIDAELEFAWQVQNASLPTVFPDRSEFSLCAKMIPAREVGGDFYDFYMRNDSSLIFLVADVSGKGIPAAMFMMKAKAILKALAESGLEPNEIFQKANENLCENNEAGMFVTAWMGILDLKTGRLQFANAGHNPPLLLRKNGEFEYLKARSGLFLGGMEGMKYRKNEMFLTAGDRIFLYTDGVTEATDATQELYGEDRLKSCVNSLGNTTAAALCEAVKADVDRFVGQAPQFDDITMLAVNVKSLLDETAISVVPNAESFETVNNFAQSLTAKLEAVPKVANKINILFDEVYANIANYSGATLAKISYCIEGRQLSVTFADNGVAYNPLDAETPDITLSADARKIGGLGIFMVKKLTNHVAYARTDDWNVLTLTLSLE